MSFNAAVSARYDAISRLNHWILAFLMIGMLGFGLYLENGVAPGPEKGALMGTHKAIGVIVLLLGLWRVGWRLWQGFLPDASAMPKWQSVSAHLAHWVLMAGIIVMPASGVIGSVFGGRAVEVFGLFTIPAGPQIEWIKDLAYGVHGIFAPILIVTTLLHVAGALKHHFIDRDTTLRRMTGRA